MTSALRSARMRQIQRFKGTATLAGVPDRQLLERFADWRGDDTGKAFAELIRRHGPLVLATCRRLLHDPNDADDAFQATFMVLARKAGSVRSPDSLGPWLYGVAVPRGAEGEVGGRASEAA